MAITVEEKYKGRSGSDSKRSITYLVRGTDDESTAIDQTSLTASGTWDGLQLKSISVTQLADEIFATTAEYGVFKKTDPPAAGSVDFSFSFAAKSEHMKQSIATVNTNAAPGVTAYDYRGAMNVTMDSGQFRVEGLDIEVPATTHSWTYYPVNATVNQIYINSVLAIMGGVNSNDWGLLSGSIFAGISQGEVRFVGCRGGKRSDSDWQIQFDFAFKPAQTLDIGNITGVEKKGHEIVWVLYETMDDSNGWTVMEPAVAYVEQVVPYVDFSVLGI